MVPDEYRLKGDISLCRHLIICITKGVNGSPFSARFPIMGQLFLLFFCKTSRNINHS